MAGKKKVTPLKKKLERMERRVRASFDTCVVGAKGKEKFACRNLGRAAKHLAAAGKLLDEKAPPVEAEAERVEPVLAPTPALEGPQGTDGDSGGPEGT